MTLGQRISQYRKGLGISQEELGARLGVSRQAVSKWETGAAAPDMNNLMALAREFNISLAELTETPDEPASKAREDTADVPEPTPRQFSVSHRSFRSMVCAVSAVFLLLAVAFFYDWTIAAAPGKDALVDAVTATFDEPPTRCPATDFALLWTNSDGNDEFLELGIQEDCFPFGTTLELAAPEEVLDTDFHLTALHNTVCGAVNVSYLHTEEEADAPAQDAIISLSTIAASIHTPQRIHVGSTKADIAAAYGDDLVYCFKEDGYTLIPHDYYYAYQTAENPTYSLLFFMRDGQVAGILAEDVMDQGLDAYAPNNVSRFPTINGEPDFSQRREPERENLSDTQKVYIAWNQLVTNNNLSAEELYTYRWTVFSSLSDLDWWTFGKLGTTENPDDTIGALLSWLRDQAPYGESEIFRLQMGCQSNLDGWLADSYASVLSRALFSAPVDFVKGLAYPGLEDTMSTAVSLTAYDAIWYSQELQQTVDALDSALASDTFTEEEAGWCRLLLLYLTVETEDGSFAELPKVPAELT